MSVQPWKDQPTPLTDAANKNLAAGQMIDHARALEQRMRAAEALLARYTLATDSRDVNKHLAAAREMDGINTKLKSGNSREGVQNED